MRFARSALLVAALLCACAQSARAEVAGSVDLRGLYGSGARYGGGIMADLWMRTGRLQYGAATGVAALSGNDAASSRVLTPLALSFAVTQREDASGLFAVVRAGVYLGAEKGGFIRRAGFTSGAVGYAFGLGEGATFRVSADVWGLIERRGGVFAGPALGLAY